jgi:cytosine/adenosine deaminase-related metal-dependent hydrolase
MGRVLLTGATVWAGPACVPSRAWMLVEDGRVAALAGQEPPPPDDRVVDLPGCHLLPGFVDVHPHLSQAAWIPRGGDGWAWRSLVEALRAVRGGERLAAGPVAAVLERGAVELAGGQVADQRRAG